MSTVANAIKKIRYSLHLGQREFGETIGVTQQSVYSYEAGTRKPSLATLKKIKQIAVDNNIEFNLEDFLDYD